MFSSRIWFPCLFPEEQIVGVVYLKVESWNPFVCKVCRLFLIISTCWLLVPQAAHGY